MKRSQNRVGYFAALSLALFACGGNTGTGGDGGGGGGGGSWHNITLPSGQGSNDVLSVYCTATSKCVIGTAEDVGGDPGAVFAASDTAVGEKLVDGSSDELMSAANAGATNGFGFIGFEQTRNGVMARLNVSGAYVSATGDITAKGSWTFVPIGMSDGEGITAANEQDQLQVDANGNWIFINNQGYVYNSTMAPGPTTNWTKLWGPQSNPRVPEDFDAQHTADPSLCDTDVSVGAVVPLPNPNWVAQDLSVIILPAHGQDSGITTPPGVCISVDKGKSFHSVPFTGLPSMNSPIGPLAVTCLDKDHCFAFNGVGTASDPGTAYVYYTSNASSVNAAGVPNSNWTPATVPAAWATSDTVYLQAMFFAPDGIHGWIVGNDDNHALLVRTTDGGHTWTDVSASVKHLADNSLYGGFALDADHIWLGGRFGTLMATSSAQK